MIGQYFPQPVRRLQDKAQVFPPESHDGSRTRLVQCSAHKERFVTVPAGAIIETTAALQEPGLVTITLNGHSLLAFQRDIIERAEALDDSRTSGHERQQESFSSS
jgi:hypothetical protein